VIITEHWPFTMELGLIWLFLVIFKGVLQRTRNIECVSGHDGRKSVTVS
jgi:hypothetical protein